MTESHSLKGARIAVFGAGGMMGTDLVTEITTAGAQAVALAREDCDITNPKACLAAVGDSGGSIIINCAAYTDVNGAESHRDDAFLVNVTGTANLAQAARQLDIRFVHISTDYVFNGEKEEPYETQDPTDPINVYGKSKLAGERAIGTTGGNWLIARTSWLYGPNGPNFVKTMLRMGQAGKPVRVVNDQFGSPTYTSDLAVCLLKLCETDAKGIVHATGSGSCSWYEFAREIFRQGGCERTPVEPVPASEYPTPARRPRNSRLSPASLDKWGVPHLPDWRDALARYMKRADADTR